MAKFNLFLVEQMQKERKAKFGEFLDLLFCLRGGAKLDRKLKSIYFKMKLFQINSKSNYF